MGYSTGSTSPGGGDRASERVEQPRQVGRNGRFLNGVVITGEDIYPFMTVADADRPRDARLAGVSVGHTDWRGGRTLVNGATAAPCHGILENVG